MSNIPKDLKYTFEHEWVRIEGDEATISITDFLQDYLGDFVSIELPRVGSTFSAGDTLGSLESVLTNKDLFAPVSCSVIENNELVMSGPEIINHDSQETGWLVKIKINNSADVKMLLSAEDYAAHAA